MGQTLAGAKSADESKDDATCPLCKENDHNNTGSHWIREGQAKPVPGTRRDYIAPVTGDIKIQRKDRHLKTPRSGHMGGNDHNSDNYLRQDSKAATVPTIMHSQNF